MKIIATEDEQLLEESKIKLHIVNDWLESNVERMKTLTIMEPTDWAEGGGTCWGV